MQFHLNGFKPGDPEILGNERESPDNSQLLPKEADVIIVGCGDPVDKEKRYVGACR